MTTLALDFDRPADRQAAATPESRGLARDEVRLLVDAAGRVEHARFIELPRFLPAGTLLVVNRSATLPASLSAAGPAGAFQLNLSTDYGGGVWLAEPRRSRSVPGPLPLEAGETIEVAGLAARLLAPFPRLPRLWFVRIDGDVRAAMTRADEPIRYGYLEPPFPSLDAYQTVFADVPGSAEMPSAGRPFSDRVLDRLWRQGVGIVPVVLHAGVSSLDLDAGEIEDQALYPEPLIVPPATAAAVNAARDQGRPVIAVGTTVVRALESARDGDRSGRRDGSGAGVRVRPVRGFTRRFVHPGRPVRTVDGLITGFHDPRASHLAMLLALADPDDIRAAYAEALREGYLWHEFGDSHLILPCAA